MSENIIEIIGLTYKNIFNDFSLGIEENKFITIAGPNNCGKTTLLRMLDNQIEINNTFTLYDIKLEDYKLTDLYQIMKIIIPGEINYVKNTLEEELNYYLDQMNLSKEDKTSRYKKVIKELKLSKYQSVKLDTLSIKETIKVQLALALIYKPSIIFIDDISVYFDKKEITSIIEILKQYQQENTTIVLITSSLEIALLSDYLYVINESKIMIEGNPIEIIEKDNIMNKAGLNLPFMIDLSVKLRDYELVNCIEQDKDRMVDLLWK
jgi:energy-coupling factor transport system ATP-binding protein